MLVVLRAKEATLMRGGLMGYSRYVDHLEVMGGWVLVTRLAQELGILDNTAYRHIHRLAKVGRVEVRTDDRGLQAKSTEIVVNV